MSVTWFQLASLSSCSMKMVKNIGKQYEKPCSLLWSLLKLISKLDPGISVHCSRLIFLSFCASGVSQHLNSKDNSCCLSVILGQIVLLCFRIAKPYRRGFLWECCNALQWHWICVSVNYLHVWIPEAGLCIEWEYMEYTQRDPFPTLPLPTPFSTSFFFFNQVWNFVRYES